MSPSQIRSVHHFDLIVSGSQCPIGATQLTKRFPAFIA
jgi:hypothetical protein